VKRVCLDCGTVVRPEVRFCENCGKPLLPSTEKTTINQKTRFKPNIRMRKILKTGAFCLGVLLVLLLSLFILGSLTEPKSPLPIFAEEGGPVLVVGGVSQDGSLQPVQPGQFSVHVSSETGVQRVEVYSDGQIVAADNIEDDQAGQPVELIPAIDTLPAGEHEVIVVVYDNQGRTSQSSVIPVVISPTTSAGSGSADVLVIEPPLSTLPAPTGFSGVVSTRSDQVDLSWGTGGGNESSFRVYARWPQTASFVLVAKPSSGATSVRLPLDSYGTWQFSIAAVDAGGREGSLASISLLASDPRNSSAPASSSEVISFTVLDIQTNDPAIKYMYAYVRLGGEGNRYQRVPKEQGTYLESTSAGHFSATVPGFDWPVDQPLPVEVEMLGWTGSELRSLGTVSRNIKASDYPNHTVVIEGSTINANLLFQTQLMGGEQTGSGSTMQNTTRSITLTPPANLHYVFYSSDCELVASRLGKLRDALRDVCRSSLLFGMRGFLIWEWPASGVATGGIGEDDLTGFEFKFVKTDANDKVIGEKITSLPFPELRGTLRNFSEVREEVACGVKKTWYLRAVGRGAASDWVYAGSVDARECPPPQNSSVQPLPDYPPYNGCGGQSDKVPDLVPDMIFESSCNAHDQCYNRDWSGHNKVFCDNVFLVDMSKACVTTGVGILLPEYCMSAAFTYYEAVNLVGRFFYEGNIDAMDCIKEPATDVSLCLVGSSPEVWNETVDITKTIYNASGTIMKSGYEVTKDGTIVLANATVNGLKTVGSGIAKGGKWIWGEAGNVYHKVCSWSWCP